MEACFSGPALSLLAAIGAVLQGAIVTLFWLYVRSKDAQIVDAKAREAEWRRVALRGAEEIIPDLAREVRTRVRDRYPELRGPEAP
jgi:hypothetical protein